MEPIYTRKNIARAVDDARYLARRTGRNVWTVAHENNSTRFANIIADGPPTGRHIAAGCGPEGEPLAWTQAGGFARPGLKTFEIYDRSDPPRHLGQEQARTRADAARQASIQYGSNVRIALAGEASAAEVRDQVAREDKARRDDREHARRKIIRIAKRVERERFARARLPEARRDTIPPATGPDDERTHHDEEDHPHKGQPTDEQDTQADAQDRAGCTLEPPTGPAKPKAKRPRKPRPG